MFLSLSVQIFSGAGFTDWHAAMRARSIPNYSRRIYLQLFSNTTLPARGHLLGYSGKFEFLVKLSRHLVALAIALGTLL